MTEAFDDLAEPQRAMALAVARQFDGIHRLGVAFSGGVDSAVVLAIAVRALGADQVVALMSVSDVVPAHERELAHQVAAEIGASLVEFRNREFDLPDFKNNTLRRCAVCKDAMYTVISHELVAEHQLDAVAHGENIDDLRAIDRLGSGAAAKHQIMSPLAEAGLTKADVRALARALNVSVADKPSSPCLATRIPHGDQITVAKLRQIEAAEVALHQLGFNQCRVRHHGSIARIEVPTEHIGRLVDQQVRIAVVQALKEAGFAHITLDLAGMHLGAFTTQAVQNHG